MYGKTEAVFVVYMAVDRLFVESNLLIFLQNSFADSLLGNYLFMSKLSNTMRNHLECLSDDMFLDREHHFLDKRVFFFTFSAERGKHCSCLWITLNWQ